jgi:hypothetical protein
MQPPLPEQPQLLQSQRLFQQQQFLHNSNNSNFNFCDFDEFIYLAGNSEAFLVKKSKKRPKILNQKKILLQRKLSSMAH